MLASESDAELPLRARNAQGKTAACHGSELEIRSVRSRAVPHPRSCAYQKSDPTWSGGAESAKNRIEGLVLVRAAAASCRLLAAPNARRRQLQKYGASFDSTCVDCLPSEEFVIAKQHCLLNDGGHVALD